MDAPYWQQRADYVIHATLSPDGRTITASQRLTYFNHSPDTLRVIYLKAFPNSAREGSLMDRRARQWEDYAIAESDSTKWGSLTIDDVIDGAGQAVRATLDDTIYELFLNTPLAPGDSTQITLQFTSRLPSGIGARHGLTEGQTKAAYWYPQVCVYDRKLGWVNAPYIGRGECYGDFGSFDVTITAPEDRIVVATGVLTNRDEALPQALRDSLDISHFQKPAGEWPRFSYDSAATKTWIFHADSVNDFAWVASADFCMTEGSAQEIPIEIYPRRASANSWKNALLYAQRSVESYGEWCGRYRWPLVKVTDSYDGMEYPMLAFCSGGEPSPRFPLLIYHEIGHFWFMGLIGSNQVDRACLDEGFNTHVEIAMMEKYHGRAGNIDNYTNWFAKQYYPHDEDRDNRGLRQYISWAKAGYDLPMIVSADNTSEYWAYRVSSYYKVVAMHFSLRSIYGDSLYWRALREYCEKWMFRHPYEEDFVASFSESVGENLNQYFDQWFTSRRTIDYSFKGKRPAPKIGKDKYEVTVEAVGEFVSPIDVAIITNNQDTLWRTINPEGHSFVKPGFQSAGVWRQYRQSAQPFTFPIEASSGIHKVIVDPHELLADINRLNNASGFMPHETKIDPLFFDIPSLHKYSLRLRPDLWFDDNNGLTLGAHSHGSYIWTDRAFSLDAAYATRAEKPFIDASVSHPFRPLGRLSRWGARYLRSDDRSLTTLKLTKTHKTAWSRSAYLTGDISWNFLRYAHGGMTPGITAPQSVSWIEPSFDLSKQGRRWGIELSGAARLSYRERVKERLASFSQQEMHFGVSHRIRRGLNISYSFRGYFSGYDSIPLPFLSHLSRASEREAFSESRLFREPGTIPNQWQSDVYLTNGAFRGYQDTPHWGSSVVSEELLLRGLPLMRMLPVKYLPVIGKRIAQSATEIFLDHGRLCYNYLAEYALTSETRSIIAKSIWSAGVSIVTPSLWHGQCARLDFPFYLSHPSDGAEKWKLRFSVAWLLPTKQEYPEFR